MPEKRVAGGEPLPGATVTWGLSDFGLGVLTSITEVASPCD